MRKTPSRMTFGCPLCSAQIIVRLLIPTPAHRDTKATQVLIIECPTPGCEVGEEHVRKLLHMPAASFDTVQLG
jgi:hypothetical protein